LLSNSLTLLEMYVQTCYFDFLYWTPGRLTRGCRPEVYRAMITPGPASSSSSALRRRFAPTFP